MSSKPPTDAASKRTPNVYAGAHVDRAAQVRKDAASLQAALNEGQAGFVPVWRERNLLTWVDRRPTARLFRSSQPWPFPSSLMLGFAARAASTRIDCRDAELEDARWFTRADIASGKLILSSPQSIAFRLIEDWYDDAAERPLRNEPSARVAEPRR